MATGDPIACTVMANGWEVEVDFEGLSGRVGTDVVADYVAGFASTDVPTTDAANFYFTVTSEGYDATGTLGTIARTVYVTRAQRKPDPDDADLQASVVDTTNMRVRFVLSDPIYNDDTATCTIKAALNANTNAGTPSVTNSSTFDYPPVTTVKWCTPAGQQLSGTFRPALFAKHPHGMNGRSVAAVRFTLTRGLETLTEIVTAPEVMGSSRDPDYPLKIEVYRPTFDISTIGSGSATLRAQVYPWVGDADSVFDSNAATFPAAKASQPHEVGGTRYYAYVSSDGDDGAGVASATAATAKASPYATIWGARNGLNSAAGTLNNCEIRLEGGSSFAWGRTSFAGVVTAPNAFLTVTTDPDDTEQAVLNAIAATGGELRCARVRLINVRIAPTFGVNTSSNFFASVGADDLYQFEGCTARHSGVGTTMKASAVEFFRAFDSRFEDFISSFSTDQVLGEFINYEVSFNINSAEAVGCDFDLASNFGGSAVFPTSASAQFILAHCRAQNDGSAFISLGHATTNSYIGHCIFKRTSDGTQPGIQANNIDIAGLQIEHLTMAGCRVNPQNESLPNNSQTGIYVNGLASPYTAPKHDTFGSDGTLIGGWWMFFGVALRNSFNGDSETFPFAYPGTNIVSRVSATSAEREAGLYVDNNSVFGDDDAATFGDYTPASGSDLIGLIPAGQASSSFDLFGTTIPNDGTGSAGAVQAEADEPDTTGSTVGMALPPFLFRWLLGPDD